MSQRHWNRTKYRKRIEKICSSQSIESFLKDQKPGDHVDWRSYNDVGRGDFEESQTPSSIEDRLNLALRLYLKGFSCGGEHDDHEARIACAQTTKSALQPERVLTSNTLRGYIGDLLKARVQMRKALQLQRKKKELFASARKSLSDSMIAQADENSRNVKPGSITRTPWQLLLHKGAPGSRLTREFSSHENAQLVPLPLLKLLANMTSEWKKAHRDIVQGSFQDRNKAGRPKCPYEHIHRTCRHANISLDPTFSGEASNPERGRATQDLETLNDDYAVFNIEGEVEPDVQVIHMALAVQDMDKTR